MAILSKWFALSEITLVLLLLLL